MALRVLSVFGTRPEAIKMVPVIRALTLEPGIESLVCVTYQHKEMLIQVLDLFSVKADFRLDVMQKNQSLAQLFTRLLDGLQSVILSCRPDILMVHGDTSSCLAGALAAFYSEVPVVHIEAGLRTGNLRAPFPEEAHRQMVSRIASLHLVPTPQAAGNLFAENICPDSVYVTGNTIVDVLRLIQARIVELPDRHFAERLGNPVFESVIKRNSALALITLHRRELSGEKFTRICKVIRNAARNHPDWIFVYPVHLNPNIYEPAHLLLEGETNIHLVPPLDYLTFIWLIMRSDLLITDSGGVQEEAEVLKKPLLVIRDHTDRPEALARANAELAGTRPEQLTESLGRILARKVPPAASQETACAPSLFGDGNAARRIVRIIKQKFGVTG